MCFLLMEADTPFLGVASPFAPWPEVPGKEYGVIYVINYPNVIGPVGRQGAFF